MKGSISTVIDHGAAAPARLREPQEQYQEFEIFDSTGSYVNLETALRVESDEVLAERVAPSIREGNVEAEARITRPLISETNEGVVSVVNRIKDRLTKTRTIASDSVLPVLPVLVDNPVEASNSGVETYRAQIATAVRTATEKMHRAEESLQQALVQIEAEVALRKTAEGKVRELEEKYSRHATSVETLELKRMELEYSLEELQAQLQTERKRKESLEHEIFDARANTDVLALKMVKLENARANAENKAAEADRMVREVERMLDQSEALATEANTKFKAIESRLLQERELRLFAEQQLKALVEEFNITLDVDSTEITADEFLGSPSGDARAISSDSYNQQLLTGIDAERKARLEAEIQCESLRLEAAQTRELMNISQAELQSQIQAMESEIRQMNLKQQGSGKTGRPHLVAHPVPALENNPSGQDAIRKVKIIGYSAGIVVLLVFLVFLIQAALNQLL